MTNPAFWPIFTAAVASRVTAAWLADLASGLEGEVATELPPAWATPNTISLELETMSFRDFSRGLIGPPVIVCAPFAVHCATIADFAHGHSIVESLRHAGISRLFVTDWRSATASMRFLRIDSYLSDLNTAVDGFDGPVDLVGLCQGGWLAALYAARFSNKVRRLVLVGAPIDLEAASSQLSHITSGMPVSVLQALVDAGDGLVPGRRLLDQWAHAPGAELNEILQCPEDLVQPDLAEKFAIWWQQTVSLPGTYYLQTVQWLFKENRLARGAFVALGQKVSLTSIRVPVFLLAGSNDELIAPEQMFAIRDLIGTPSSDVVSVLEPARHLSLFMGRRVLEGVWTEIGRWLLRRADESRPDLTYGRVAEAS
jgi:poly(3-hydroxyalkanoate) synthetase